MATKKYAKSSNEPLGDAYLGTKGHRKIMMFLLPSVMLFLVLSLMNNMAHPLLLDQIR
jgi:hypothetical protein